MTRFVAALVVVAVVSHSSTFVRGISLPNVLDQSIRRSPLVPNTRGARAPDVCATSASHSRQHGNAEESSAEETSAPATRPPMEVNDASASPSVSALLKFVGPCLAASLTSEVMTLVDTSVVGSLSTVELACLAPAALVADTCAYGFSFLTISTTSLVASAMARKNSKAAFDAVSNALTLALSLGLVTAAVVGWYAKPLLDLALGSASTPEVLGPALSYLRVRLVGLPLILFSMVTQSALQAVRDPVAPFYAVAGGGALNLILDIVLCLQLGLGVVGAAYATLASQVVQASVLLIALLHKRSRLCPRLTWRTPLIGKPSLSVLTKFVKFAGPIFFVILGKLVSYNSMTLAVTSSGLAALAAHQVLATIFFIACKMGDALSQTVQAFLPATLDDKGRVTGATQALGGKMLLASIGCGTLVAMLSTLLATKGNWLFTRDLAVASSISATAPFLFLGLLVHSTTMTGEGVLLAMRDLASLVRSYAANIVIFVTGLFIVKAKAMGLSAVWVALVGFQIMRLMQFSVGASRLGVFVLHRSCPPQNPAEARAGGGISQ